MFDTSFLNINKMLLEKNINNKLLAESISDELISIKNKLKIQKSVNLIKLYELFVDPKVLKIHRKHKKVIFSICEEYIKSLGYQVTNIKNKYFLVYINEVDEFIVEKNKRIGSIRYCLNNLSWAFVFILATITIVEITLMLK